MPLLLLSYTFAFGRLCSLISSSNRSVTQRACIVLDVSAEDERMIIFCALLRNFSLVKLSLCATCCALLYGQQVSSPQLAQWDNNGGERYLGNRIKLSLEVLCNLVAANISLLLLDNKKQKFGKLLANLANLP